MNIYHVLRTDSVRFDQFSDFMVSAPDADTARRTYPCNKEGIIQTRLIANDGKWCVLNADGSLHPVNECPCSKLMHGCSPKSTWINISDLDTLKVTLVGVATAGTPAGVLCASYHAG